MLENLSMLETLLSRHGARQVHRRCKCPLYVPERKLGIMRCLDWPGAAHACFARVLRQLHRPARFRAASFAGLAAAERPAALARQDALLALFDARSWVVNNPHSLFILGLH
jgi:hypothetical protein